MIRIIFCLLLAAGLDAGCTKTETGSDEVGLPDVGDQQDTSVKCTGLGEAGCEMNSQCLVIFGWPADEACEVWNDQGGGLAPQFIECQDSRLCSAQFVWASDPLSPDGAWLFPSSCVPHAWSQISQAPCYSSCPDSECLDGGTRCVDGAEQHCQNACPDSLDCPWCGVWGEEAVPCDPYESCNEVVGHCVCPNAHCQVCCSGPEYVCDPLNACCLPSCDGLECGDDGCGEECGMCEEGWTCYQGNCLPPDPCGDGSCSPADGETCDDCPQDCACLCGEVCELGSCLFSACQNKACGPDGCGGMCGTCPEGTICFPDFQCRVPDCPVFYQSETVVSISHLTISPNAAPGNAFDFDADGNLDNGFPTFLQQAWDFLLTTPYITPDMEVPEDLPQQIMATDFASLPDKPRALFVLRGFNTAGSPFVLEFQYGTQADPLCDPSTETCAYLLDRDLIRPDECAGKVVIENAVASWGEFYAGGMDTSTKYAMVPSRFYVPVSFSTYHLTVQADVVVTGEGVYLENGLMGFVFPSQETLQGGFCYSLGPEFPVGCGPGVVDMFPFWSEQFEDMPHGVSAAFQFEGRPASIAGICQPDCAGKEPASPDGCGSRCDLHQPCGYHNQCFPGELCLEDFGLGTMQEACNFCKTIPFATCHCEAPTWSNPTPCTDDQQCLGLVECGDQCTDCLPCPVCVNGWCTFQTWLQLSAGCNQG